MSYTPKSGFLLDKPVKRRAPKSDFLRSLEQMQRRARRKVRA